MRPVRQWRDSASEMLWRLSRSESWAGPVASAIRGLVAAEPLSPTTVIASFMADLDTHWAQLEPEPLRVPALEPGVMVGTLHSGENEFEQCKASIEAQRYPHIRHEVLSGLPKEKARSDLLDGFERSDAELLVMVDADTVLLDEDYIGRVVEIFNAGSRLSVLQMAVQDFFSDDAIQGIDAYRRGSTRRAGSARSAIKVAGLFADETRVPRSERMMLWATFGRSAIHSPDPGRFQAFHFGVQRGLEVVQSTRADRRSGRVDEQHRSLEKTWLHFRRRRDDRLALACLGFELTLRSTFEVAHVTDSSSYLHDYFSKHYEHWTVDDLSAELERMRHDDEARGRAKPVAELVKQRPGIARDCERGITSICAVIPHTGVFGGVNRFFELSRALREHGVDLDIAVPQNALEHAHRPDYPETQVRSLEDTQRIEYDAVLCGDVTGGVMLTLPHLRARRRVAWILNGWMHRPWYLEQLAMIQPDLILANSTYAARQYADLAPYVVAGGVNLDMFYPAAEPAPLTDRPLRICTYPGRNKERKRFADTLAACESLKMRSLPFELHYYDHVVGELDESFETVCHGPLERDALRQLLHTMDVMICPEEDAGWSNPAAEAMACGVPVVCTVAGTEDFAIDGESACVVPERSPESIAIAVQKLYEDDALRLRLRRTGLGRIQAFAWANVARNLLDALGFTRPHPSSRS